MSSSVPDPLVTRLRAAGCVFAEDEAALLRAATTDPIRLESLAAQRITGVPLEHLLGWTEFHGHRVTVGPGVFVPRQRTVHLVDEAIRLARTMIHTQRPAPAVSRTVVAETVHPLTALDMCCGCGALGLAFTSALAVEGIRVELTAADIEPAAVACARENLAGFGARVVAGDLFEPVPTDLLGRVDILLANTPYVPSAEIARMPPEARDHEPRAALDGGDDGLDILRRIVAVADAWLAPGGHLLVEESRQQAAAAVAIMRANGLRARVSEDDELGATVVIGTHA